MSDQLTQYLDCVDLYPADFEGSFVFEGEDIGVYFKVDGDTKVILDARWSGSCKDYEGMDGIVLGFVGKMIDRIEGVVFS